MYGGYEEVICQKGNPRWDWSAMTVAWLIGRSAMTVAWMAGWSVMRGDGLIGLVGDEGQWVMGDGWPADRLQG